MRLPGKGWYPAGGREEVCGKAARDIVDGGEDLQAR
jgi:hypothetical protein